MNKWLDKASSMHLKNMHTMDILIKSPTEEESSLATSTILSMKDKSKEEEFRVRERLGIPEDGMSLKVA